MLSLFIFRSNSRGMSYGIGTYINQLSLSLLNNTTTIIYIVNYHSDKCKEFTLNFIRTGLYEIHIPSPKVEPFGNNPDHKYASRVIDMLTNVINNSTNVVFQVNHLDALFIVKQLKERFIYPVISVVHSAQWQFIFNGNQKKFNEVWLNKNEIDSEQMKSFKAEQKLYEISDKIVSVTRYMKNFLIDYYNIPEGKILVIPNGIDNRDFKSLSKIEKESLKQNLGFYRDEKVILFSGRLDRGKGLFFLIDAFTEVCKQYDHVRLLLVGEDSGLDKISQYLTHCKNIWAKVTFTGFVDQETMMKFYQIADVGIIPSIYDHCPYVALEMIGFNIPLILSDTEGLNEILMKDQFIHIKPSIDDDGNIGFQKNEIAGAILTLLRNNKSIAEIITNDYQELLVTRFSNKRMGETMYSLLLSLQAVKVES